MDVRFYSIEWDEEDISLPTSVVIDVDCDETDDIDELGNEILTDEFGATPNSFMWEFADEDDEEVFPDEED